MDTKTRNGSPLVMWVSNKGAVIKGALPGIQKEVLARMPEQVNEDPNTHAQPRGISVEALLKMRARLNAKADALLVAKGNDYNAAQQEAGDTLFNLRVCALMGVVPSPVDGVLVCMSDKLMRLISLTRPGTVQKVSDESIEDTGVDLKNYTDYLLALVKERRGEKIE